MVPATRVNSALSRTHLWNSTQMQIFSQVELAWELDDDASEEWRMKVWTVYEMANHQGPGRYTNTGHGTGRVASAGQA